MYTLTVRDHVMLAHSLPDPAFGPAQGLHGVTYVVEASWSASELTGQNIVLDIGVATEALRGVLAPLAYANLDERPEFAGVLTTTEFLCRWVADRLAEAVVAGNLSGLIVTLREHPDAWASYARALP